MQSDLMISKVNAAMEEGEKKKERKKNSQTTTTKNNITKLWKKNK